MICQCLADLSLPYPPPFSPFPYPLLVSTPATQATISPLYTLKRVKSDQHGPETLTFLTTVYFLHGLSDSASFDALIVGLNDLYVKKDKTENQCKNKQAKYQDNFTALSIERKVDQIELRIIPLHQIQDF